MEIKRFTWSSNPGGYIIKKENIMTELTNTLARQKSGLYDLKITGPDKRPVLEVNSITLTQAVMLIGKEEEKADRRRER